MSRLASALALAILAVGAPVRAQDAGFTRFLGGGASATDCMLVEDVAGVAPGPAARCTDGDPTCDADGRPDGACTFRVRLCIDEATTAACGAQAVAHVTLPATPALAPLVAAAATLQMPVDMPGACTEPVTVIVPRRGRGAGRVVLRATAVMASGHIDRDRLGLVCRSPGPPANFARLARTIFDVSCATTSCHGAARAGGLDLSEGNAYASLVGVAPTNEVARAAGALRVAPGDPDRSYLLAKLLGTLTAGEGTPMPQVGGQLPAARIDLIRRWIAAGAPATATF